MFCYALLYVYSGYAIILIRDESAGALLKLSYWCLVIVCVGLPRGAIGLSAASDYGIS